MYKVHGDFAFDKILVSFARSHRAYPSNIKQKHKKKRLF